MQIQEGFTWARLEWQARPRCNGVRGARI